MLTCKQATKLMSEKQDRVLSRPERFSLRIHLLMCAGCRNFDKQMNFIRQACRRIGGGQRKP